MTELRVVVVTGGGSAGHVIPAQPIIERLVRDGCQVVFIGSTSGLEEQLVAQWAVEFHGITTGKLRRYFSFQNALDLFRVPIGIFQAFKLMCMHKPNVVFSKGGYVAFPVVVAAWLARVPVVAHESDLSPGLANRLSSPFLHSLCVNFDETSSSVARVVVTGTPLRNSLLLGNPQKAREWLGFNENKRVLVVVGGSLGAESINDTIRSSLSKLTENYQIVHVCGAAKMDASIESIGNYRQFEYLDDYWGDVLALADVVISRAGAGTLYELLTLGKPNVLIPLGLSASRGDQIENAEMAERHGWSTVVPEESLSTDSLLTALALVDSQLEEWRMRLTRFGKVDSVALIHGELLSAAFN